MNKIKLVLSTFFLILSFTTWSQTSTVSGVVLDNSNTPLAGVNVVQKATTNGVVTDFDGKFSIDVTEPNSVLVFSYIGFLTQEINVEGTQSNLRIQMVEDAALLDEVVIIGYGQAKKSDLTGAVASLKATDLARANPVSAAQGIQGQMAGVNIIKRNNRPGSGLDIRIRGLSSIDFSNEPLIVIDGIQGADLNTVNPTDIETIDILKDASSTAIYGSRGANGVVIVTTKRGTKGKMSLTYNGYSGLKMPSYLPEMQNAQQFYLASTFAREQNGYAAKTFTTTEMEVLASGNGVDWVDEVTRSALQTSHNVSLSGGAENVNYYFSLGYLNEDGTLKDTDFKRYTINGGLDGNLTDHVKVGFTMNYTNSLINLGSRESLRGAYRARPTGVVYFDEILNPSENNDVEHDGYAVWMGINDKQVLNPIIEADRRNFQLETLSSDFRGNAYIEVTPFEGLSLKSSLSARKYDARDGMYRGTFTKDQRASLPPRANSSNQILTNYTFDNIINYQKTFGKSSINATVAQSAFKERVEVMGLDVENLPYDSSWYAVNTAGTINSVNSNLTERTISSYMGRLVYGFNDNRYLLTVTGRWDGASQLGDGNKWDFFPSAALAWKISDENFLKNSETISNMKIRVSYGTVGNSAVDPYSTLTRLLQTPYAFGDSPAFGFAPAALVDKDLGWEKSKELNIGLDLALFNNRISSTIEVYDRETVDLIYRERIPTSQGFGEFITNIGSVSNKGIEVALNTRNIVKDKFTWSTSVNFAKNINEVLSIGNNGVLEDIGSNLFVGQPLNSNYFYEFDGIWQLDEADEAAVYGQVPGSVKVVDQNNDGKISSAPGEDDRVILGSEQPDWTMGITNKFTFGNIDLSFLAYTVQGVQFRNNFLSGTMGEVGTGRYNALNLNYWTPDNPTNDYFGAGVPNPYRQAIQYQDASFIRISDITLGYTIPSRLATDVLGLQNLRIYAQVINPFIFHDFDGIDPEFNSSAYNDDVSSTTILLGVKCTF
nr:TonB-dependent receptor [Muricauda sp. M10]